MLLSIRLRGYACHVSVAGTGTLSRSPGDGHDTPSIGYQGSEGAYSYLAARNHFSSPTTRPDLRGYDSFQAVLKAVQEGRVDYGILPLENNTVGSIDESLDLLAHTDLALVGEELQRVDHCLVALHEQVNVSDLRLIVSHPQALAQCSSFLDTLHQVRLEPCRNTAMSAEKVRAEADPTQAAIASYEASQVNGLHILRRSIANRSDNFTRMVIVARDQARFDSQSRCKTSIVLSPATKEGGIQRCIERFVSRQLRLTKFVVRPNPRPGEEHLVFIDIDGHLKHADVAAVLRDLAPITGFLRVLGCYPTQQAQGDTADTYWTDEMTEKKPGAP